MARKAEIVDAFQGSKWQVSDSEWCSQISATRD